MPKLFFHALNMLVLHFQTSGYRLETISDESILGQKLLSDTPILLLQPKIAWFWFKTIWGTFSKKIAFSWQVDAKTFLSCAKYVCFTFPNVRVSSRNNFRRISFGAKIALRHSYTASTAKNSLILVQNHVGDDLMIKWKKNKKNVITSVGIIFLHKYSVKITHCRNPALLKLYLPIAIDFVQILGHFLSKQRALEYCLHT